ncbi:diguanylate cyclase [Phyllobacterium sp. OV277]|uniref:GGDEF domain-containing protein n=1 Tax=Phyllobacterium sp. OV277 TaxID=1882772 RepID=UPI000880206C|nr:diguanylate cyclase [Phyllobacterium sp. OV277]SDP10031.1 diguanylate cyclase [Phyllobacterium sp. OV277]
MYTEYFPIVADLVHRLGLVALVSMAYGSIIRGFHTPVTRSFMVGLLFGCSAVISMLDPVIVDQGIIVDARSILLALSAPFGGVVAVLVSTTLTIISRILIGGNGVYAGVVGIVIIGLISLIFTQVYRPKNYSWKHFIILGLTVPLYTLSIFVLPFEQALPIFQRIALPMLTLSVTGIILISMFLHRERLRVDRVKILEVDAHTDPLTNLANRRLFDRVARRTFRKAASTGGDVFSLVMIDIDSFKSINDHWGHSNGDLVLVEISTIIRSLVRKSDLVARYGGEEIAILMPTADAEEAMAMAEAIRRRVNETFFDFGRTQAHVTVSAGVSTFTSQHQSLTDLIEEADTALYRAKRLGRNRIELASIAA